MTCEIVVAEIWADDSRADSSNQMRLSFRLNHRCNRWAEVITHVPCGGTTANPAGRLLITAELKEIDGAGGILGSAGPTSIWYECNVALKGAMTFDIDDIASMESGGYFEGVIQHEMGHVVGVGCVSQRRNEKLLRKKAVTRHSLCSKPRLLRIANVCYCRVYDTHLLVPQDDVWRG